MVVYNDEKRFGDVKSAMMNHLMEKKEDYLACGWLVDADIVRLEKILQHRGPCGVEYYFSDPECSQLAADTFERPIEFHGSTSATLYLPIIRHTSYKAYRPVVLNLYQSHIYLTIMKKGTTYGYPVINLMHNTICEKLDIPNQSASYSSSS